MNMYNVSAGASRCPLTCEQNKASLEMIVIFVGCRHKCVGWQVGWCIFAYAWCQRTVGCTWIQVWMHQCRWWVVCYSAVQWPRNGWAPFCGRTRMSYNGWQRNSISLSVCCSINLLPRALLLRFLLHWGTLPHLWNTTWDLCWESHWILGWCREGEGKGHTGSMIKGHSAVNGVQKNVHKFKGHSFSTPFIIYKATSYFCVLLWSLILPIKVSYMPQKVYHSMYISKNFPMIYFLMAYKPY